MLVMCLCSLSLSGFPQSGISATTGPGLPPFQTSMSSSLGQTGMSPAMDAQKGSGLFGVESKTGSNVGGSSPLKSTDAFSSGGSGIHSMDRSAGIRKWVWLHVVLRGSTQLIRAGSKA